jgi:hypothetical protein
VSSPFTIKTVAVTYRDRITDRFFALVAYLAVTLKPGETLDPTKPFPLVPTQDTESGQYSANTIHRQVRDVTDLNGPYVLANPLVRNVHVSKTGTGDKARAVITVYEDLTTEAAQGEYLARFIPADTQG